MFLQETYACIGTFFKISVKTVKGTCKWQMLVWCCTVLQNLRLTPFGTNGALWLSTVFITNSLKSITTQCFCFGSVFGFFFFHLTAVLKECLVWWAISDIFFQLRRGCVPHVQNNTDQESQRWLNSRRQTLSWLLKSIFLKDVGEIPY